MSSLLTLAKDLEQKSKAQQRDYRRDAESRIQRAREVCPERN
ncbi:MbeB family mobilization protein [Erwinia aphidicola]